VTRLPGIQDAFQQYLLTGDPTIESHVLGTSRVPVATRLAIYGDGYQLRLIESLQTSYPVLAQLLDEQFPGLAARYVTGHPSTFPSVRHYGAQLSEFLATDSGYSGAPILAQMAAWEWAMAAAFDAADITPVGIEAFATVAPEDWAELRFGWHPSAHILELHWNVPQLWKAVTEGTDQPDPALLEDGGSHWLLWRTELQIYFRPLQATEAMAITMTQSGKSFGELCIALCEHLDEQQASVHAAGLLRGWVEAGLITSAAVPP
jgi:Putative DNA-binding domain